jgi:rubredoxin---NAD+ reductase
MPGSPSTWCTWASWPLERLLPVEAGQRLADSLAALGVNWHFGRMRKKRRADVQRPIRVTLDNGETVAADVVLSAIGLKPRTQLAQAAGIKVGRGIQTNGLLETSAPHVYAMGDCAEVEGLNLPYVQPLMVQARALAATLTGTPTRGGLRADAGDGEDAGAPRGRAAAPHRRGRQLEGRLF